MKSFKAVLAAFAIIVIGAAVMPQKGDARKWAAGMKVAAPWTDGNYYLAVIRSLNGDMADVDYADGTSGTVESSTLREIPARPKLSAGYPVLAVWSTGARFYGGVVLQVKPKGAVIQWDDGSEPSLVVFGKIIVTGRAGK